MAVQGVLFDSGDTLIGPRGGRWNPRFDFENTVSAWWPDAPNHRFAAAVAAGDTLLDERPTASRRDYHRAMLAALGVADPPTELLADLERPLPADQLVEVFPDVVPALDRIRSAGVPIALVTDNWSTIRQLYDDLGLARYVESFIISEELGCTKPDPRMYQAGSDALGLAPNACLFVDDDPHLVVAALDLGYDAYLIDRTGSSVDVGIPTVTSLDHVAAIVGA